MTSLSIIILAGGKGRRLWPESQVALPKQFVDFFGTGRSQLQQTYDRFRSFVSDEQIYVVTNKNYFDLVREQVPNVPLANILAEPVWRNTGPSVAWATQCIAKRDEHSVVVIAPSDHQILNQEIFERDVQQATAFVAENDTILCMGVPPTRPEPGYGYIQVTSTDPDAKILPVKTFIEKPEREFAQMFMLSGEFLWNSGIYIANVEHLQAVMSEHVPTAAQFAQYPNVSFEMGLLEKVDAVSVMRCGFGWADMGSWHSMYEACTASDNRQADDNDNVVLDSDVILENAHHNIIKIPRGNLAVINGLEGYIVVEKDNMLLICPREDSSALIRKYSAEVEIR